MRINLSFKNIALLALAGLLFVFILSSRRSYRKEIDRLNTDKFTQVQTINTKSFMIGELRQQLFLSEASVVSTQKAVRDIAQEKEYFKKLHINDLKSISNLEMKIDILNKQGSYRDTVIRVDTVTIDTVKYVNWSDEWAWMKVLLYDKPIVNLGINPSPVKVHIYYEGWVKPKPMVAVSTPNPYIQFDKLNTVIVEDKKKFLQKKYPYFIAGLVGGYLIFK